MTQQAQAEALRKIAHYNNDHLTTTEIAAVYAACDELERLHARVQELAEKAAKYDHLRPYLCKTCGGYGLVDRRCHDDPLGAEDCPDCNAPTPPEQERKPLTDAQIETATGAKQSTPLFLAAKGFAIAIERAHGIGVETK